MSQRSSNPVRRLVALFVPSVLLAFALLGSLIYVSGPWNFIANTRLLDLMISGGLTRVTAAPPPP